MGIRPKDLSEIVDGKSTLGNWYVNIATIDRRKTLLFVNERTSLSFILYGVKKSNIANIHEMFLKALNQLLHIEGVEYPVLDALNNEYLNLEYTKTDSKQVLGNMNDIMFMYRYFIHSEGGLKYCDLTEITHKINKTPRKNIGYSYAIDLTKELLLCNRT